MGEEIKDEITEKDNDIASEEVVSEKMSRREEKEAKKE